MTASDKSAQIRRLFFAESCPVGTIASELGVHHDTVGRVIGSDALSVVQMRWRLMSVCSYAAPFFAELMARDEPMRAHCTKLNRLLDDYGAPALNAALADALVRGAITAASVAGILDQERRHCGRR